MQKVCTQCQAAFPITPADLSFLEKVSPVFSGKRELIPPPTLCPDCRVQRRFAQRNERSLYKRTCDLTGVGLVSFYHSDSPYKVFEKNTWWSDRWDGVIEGRPFDFSRPFFEQFHTLRRTVPRLGMMMPQSEGSAYSAYCSETKNCYMCSSCVMNDDSFYCYQTNASRTCADCSTVTNCELCYECLYCYGLTACAYCKDCENGSGLFFCQDCRGCTDCIGCKNLVNQTHCVFNERKTPDEYAAIKRKLTSHAGHNAISDAFRKFALTLPTRAAHLVQCENCTGDHLRQCRNSFGCFEASALEDCANVFPAPGLGMKDCHDCHYSPGSELVYDSLSTVRSTRARFVLHSWNVDDVCYTDECFSSRNLFGCIGLRHKEYCILNKQYTKEEYEILVLKIIEHMRKSGEWGEYPPVTISPFAYNESIAQESFPLTQREVMKRGWRWKEQKDEMPHVTKVIPASKLPNAIDDIPDDILNWAIECEMTKRPFKIIKQELEFYRTLKIPVPRLYPDERHRRRMALRNPRKLWDRECAKCGKEVQTTYAHERPEIVYCESCYLKEVY